MLIVCAGVFYFGHGVCLRLAKGIFSPITDADLATPTYKKERRMMKGFVGVMALLVCVFGLTDGSRACNLDYGDAVGYDTASNEKGIWQRLGEVNGIDDGVVWSVDGGTTWGDDIDLIIGEEVTFKFNFWQGNNGIHTYDQLLAVLDWDQDKKWEMPSETLIYQMIETKSPFDQTPDDLSDSRYIPIIVTVTVPDTIIAGSSTWLRARVTCNHTPYPDVTPYGYLAQGETEDYKLTFAKAPVPEPTTMLLFGAGLAGLAAVGRRRRNN